MTKPEAINVLTQVCNQYKGTLQEHQILQEALKVIDDTRAIPDPPPSEPSKPSKPRS